MDELEVAKLVVPVVSSWFAPAIQSIVKKYGEIKIDKIPLWSSGFEAYLARSYAKYQFINTIVFPNQKLKLDDLYEPLTLTHQGVNGAPDSVIVNRFPRTQLEAHKNILIVDTAGMGKSTIAKYIFLAAIRENIGIPLLIELRRLSKERTIIEFIKSELAELKDYISADTIIKLINEGGFIFIFDGYDEIAQEDRASVTEDIQDFRERAKANKFVMTSRDEPGLSAFPDFLRCGIQPMTEDQAYSLISRYARSANVLDTGNKLIEKLKTPDSASVKEFLSNPLLVSLLFKAFDYKHLVPLKRVLFYRQVFDALFELHDLSKDGGELVRTKKSGLGIDDFDRVLRRLAFIQVRTKKVEYSKDELLENIAHALNRSAGLISTPSDFLSDLILAVPIFVVDGIYYRWAHKSIQEYFAAQFICRDTKGEQANILVRLALGSNAQAFLNLLSLCYEIDPQSFIQSVARAVANEILSVSQYSGNYPNVSKAFIERRKCVTALCESAIVRFAPEDFELDVTTLLREFNAHELVQTKVKKDHTERAERITGGSEYRHAEITAVVMPHKKKPLLEYFAGKPGFDFVRPHGPEPHQISPDAEEYLKGIIGAREFVIVTDDPENPLNAPECFDGVTDLIAVTSNLDFNMDACEKTLAQINEGIDAAQSELATFGNF